ncbi:MAG TPA: 3-oxoacid CoA-transferase subunit A [Candidatus Dormibacteraeota bacterium]|nr:3-oxoacid CoA-transferase subunit A [Candidatus Dormibacteraeota bacterium]
MDKVVASPAEAIGDLPDGASIAVSGFGQSAGSPVSLLAALCERGSRRLCLVGNTIQPGARPLIERRQVSRLIMSFTARAGSRTAVEEQIAGGEIAYELVPQGTLVERLRAAGAGLAGVYTPTGVGTRIAEGKELRYFGGRPYLLETAIHVDYAFISGHRADRLGNVEFRGANQHFGPSFAKAARVAVVEVDEVVEPGEIPPERIGLPGIFVSRVVRKTLANTLPKHATNRRPADVARTYHGKPAWTRSQMAERAAALLPEPSYVNLGLGIPTYISTYLRGRDIVLHGENGILGYGEIMADEETYPDVFNAGGQPVSAPPGISFFDSVTAFEMVRSGRVHVVALGAYQVDQEGGVANWSTPEMVGGGIGGAMDLVAGGATVMVLMEHRDSHNRPKLVRRCTYPLTGVGCVDLVVTDLAVLRRRRAAFVLEEVAQGFTPTEVQALTDMELQVDPGREAGA